MTWASNSIDTECPDPMPDFLRDLDDIISLRQSFKSDPPMHTESENSNGPGSPVAGGCAQAVTPTRAKAVQPADRTDDPKANTR